MKVSVIKPIINIEQETNKILIEDFMDEQGNKLTIEELLNVNADTKYYCYAYQASVAAIEANLPKGTKTINFTSMPYYTGSSRKTNTFIPEHFLSKDSVDSTLKMYFNGYTILFRDLSKWFPNSSVFRTSQEEQLKMYEQLVYFEENHIAYLASKRKGDPKTLASLSRDYIGNPSQFKNPKRDRFLKDVEYSYIGAYNYIKKTHFTWEHLYHFDVKSMYPYMLMNRYYPNPKYIPIKYDDFVDVKGPAIYHINYIKAKVKKNHFPTIFCEEKLMKSMGINDVYNLNWHCSNELYGWITSVDLEMLKRDYHIEMLYIDTTYAYRDVVIGSELFGTKIVEIFNEKEASRDNPYKREANKLLINTYSGSIGMRKRKRYKVDHLTNPQKKVMVKEQKDEGFSAWDISAFMTAYARQYITELALLAGYENVACINVDAVAVVDPTPLLPFTGKNLGDLEMDREMFNAYWWRINTYEWQDGSGVWNARIAGLPNTYYVHGKTEYVVPKILYDTKKHYYYKRVDRFNIEED